MRICMVCGLFHPAIGGIETHVLELSKQLINQGHEVFVLTSNPACVKGGNRLPDFEEIDGPMHLTPARVRWLLKVSRRPLPLEKPVGEEKDSELGEFIGDDDSPTPPDMATESLLAEKMEEILATLSPREARILRLRFGLQDGRAYTLKEVGAKFGLTRERIRQIEREALARLRHPSRSRQLREYME